MVIRRMREEKDDTAVTTGRRQRDSRSQQNMVLLNEHAADRVKRQE